MLSPRNTKRSGLRARIGSQTGCGLPASAQEPKARRDSVRSRAGCGSETGAAASAAKARVSGVPPQTPSAPAIASDWRSSSRLFIGSPLVPEPAPGMLALRIVMRPVHDAALVVPFVLAAELDEISFAQRLDARREVDIVRDQDSLAGIELEDEALMAVAEAVVAEDAGDTPAAAHRGGARAALVGRGDRVVSR